MRVAGEADGRWIDGVWQEWRLLQCGRDKKGRLREGDEKENEKREKN